MRPPPPNAGPPVAPDESGADALPTIALPAGGAPAARLARPSSPLVHMYRRAGWLGDPELRGDTHRVDHLYGPHGLKYPVMALLVRRHLGPVRHALAQRTVAGGLTVIHAPGDRPTVPAAPTATPSSSDTTTTSPTPATR